MTPAPNPFKTRTIGAPSDVPECHPLEIEEGNANGMPVMCSAWEPTTEELAALNRGEKIWLFVYGASHPMVWMTAGERPPTE